MDLNILLAVMELIISDFHLGIGWGRLSGDKNQINNPLKQISESLEKEIQILGLGGELEIGDYFSGNSAALFGGIFVSSK